MFTRSEDQFLKRLEKGENAVKTIPTENYSERKFIRKIGIVPKHEH